MCFFKKKKKTYIKCIYCLSNSSPETSCNINVCECQRECLWAFNYNGQCLSVTLRGFYVIVFNIWLWEIFIPKLLTCHYLDVFRVFCFLFVFCFVLFLLPLEDRLGMFTDSHPHFLPFLLFYFFLIRLNSRIFMYWWFSYI